MITSLSLSQLRRVSASVAGLSETGLHAAGRMPSVALCDVRMKRFRSLQSTATIAVCRNVRVERHLRPRTQPIVAGQFCTNRNKALRKMELRQTRKKYRGLPALPHADPLVSQGKPLGSGAPKRHETGNNTTQNRQSRARPTSNSGDLPWASSPHRPERATGTSSSPARSMRRANWCSMPGRIPPSSRGGTLRTAARSSSARSM